MEQVKAVKTEQRKNGRTQVSPLKQATAVLAALAMSALMGLSMLAIGGSAYLSTHTVSTLTHAVSTVIALL
jgi:hypothetical protein